MSYANSLMQTMSLSFLNIFQNLIEFCVRKTVRITPEWSEATLLQDKIWFY